MDEILTAAIELENKEEAIDQIMKMHGQEILQLTFSYVSNRAVAEDLTQEIFVKCYKSLHTYNKKSKLRTWLWQIAINHCKDYLRSWYHKNVFVTENDEDRITDHASVETAIIKKDEDEQLAEAVMSLPVQYREVIYLFYYEDLSLREISEVTDINENTVKTRLRRAKEILKERLEV